jgi:arylsulfatase A-like enzyme
MVAAHFGIRTQRYKLIRFYHFDEWEFYDLKKDPDELANVHGDVAYAEEIAKLKKDLAELRSQYKDDSNVAPNPEYQKKFRPQK